jgi:hypothetical protein
VATLALSAAGAAAGSSLLPGGLSVFGTAISGATLGAQVGALAGRVVDQALLGAGGRGDIEGPRLDGLRVTASTEGAPIPRVYGAARVGGQVIWAQDFEEVVSTETVGGGKGGMGQGQQQTTYSYYASFAVAVCEGVISGIDRIWADGQELDQVDLDIRVYSGSETQAPDPLISSAYTEGAAPAFRGTAYVVFERMPIGPYGNRIPQLSFEVVRTPGALANGTHATVLIPGTGEFSCATTEVTRTGPDGVQVSENRHTTVAATDLDASVSQMATALPHVEQVSFVVSWFGTDLRAGHCEIKPGVDAPEKATEPMIWSVSGIKRDAAHVISVTNGRANYGGTPSDEAVVQGIRELKARGYDVMITPFVLMDIPEGNTLLDPYTGFGGQPPHPWRGRITVDPAPGRTGTADQTAAARSQVEALVGTAGIADFQIDGDTVRYTGPPEWSLRRQVLHYAHLAVAAGGVGSFLLGSELSALTQVRSSRFAFPFVEALVQLAADVRQVLGPGTKISYAADWSEYFGFQPVDGSGDVLFHLDPLWASPDIDAVAIDLYWPLSDWRLKGTHVDEAVARMPTDLEYLRGKVRGGEGFDWYYASAADRDAQIRTPITDGLGKPWVFRYKDLAGWWTNAHYNRTSGNQSATPTNWVPRSKPIWLTEVGCPALDNGANQPNVFYDPKSSESALPYYSRGVADEFMQRRYIEAFTSVFDPAGPAFDPQANPLSTVYTGRMIEPSRIYLYAWDLRPAPAFPHDRETWSDGANWRFGHWLNGRANALTVAELLELIATDYDLPLLDTSQADGLVHGLVIDRVMSFREAVRGVQLAFFLDFIERGDRIFVRSRAREKPVGRLRPDDLVEVRQGAPLLERSRAQETELPNVAKIGYLARDGSYAAEVAEAQRQTAYSSRVSEAQLGLMMASDQAGAIAENWLHEAWVARSRSEYTVPPSMISLEAGDVITIETADTERTERMAEVRHGIARQVNSVAFERRAYTAVPRPGRIADVAQRSIVGRPRAVYLDLPILRDPDAETDGYLAVYQTPWPGNVGVYRSAGATGFERVATATGGAVVGVTVTELQPGPCWVTDHASVLDVQLYSGTVQSVPDDLLYEGANAAAVVHPDGTIEVFQFKVAELIGARRYRLSGLLRGQLGTEFTMASSLAAGANFVLLNQGLTRLDLESDDLNRVFNWRFGPDGKPFLGPSFATAEHEFRGVGLRPYAPVHLRGVRGGAGIDISWTRRTRVDGDNWEQAEVPLNEEREAYRIEVLSGGQVVRTSDPTAPAWTYPNHLISADFGSFPAAIDIRVAQLSTRFGPGAFADAQV